MNNISGLLFRLGTLGLVLGVIFLAGGCKMEMESNLYLSLIPEAETKATPLALESRIRFQVLSREFFDSEEETIRGLLTNHFGLIQGLRCEEAGMEAFALAKTRMALARPGSGSPGGLFWLGLEKQSGSRGLALRVDRQRFARFAAEVEESMGDTVRIEDLSMKLNIINDLNRTAAVSVFSSYLDGAPGAGWQSRTLEARQSAQVRLSAIALGEVQNKGELLFFKLTIPGEAKPEPDPSEPDQTTSGDPAAGQSGTIQAQEPEKSQPTGTTPTEAAKAETGQPAQEAQEGGSLGNLFNKYKKKTN